MLDNLLDIEVAYSLIKETSDSEDPLDSYYKKLKTLIKVGDHVGDHMLCHHVGFSRIIGNFSFATAAKSSTTTRFFPFNLCY